MSDKELYNVALQDFDNNRDESLWLKSKVECLGDKDKAKYLYLKLRVEELRSEIKYNTKNSETKLVQFLKESQVYIEGSIRNLVEKKFCEIVKTNEYRKVLCDLFVSEDLILLAPTCKDLSDFMIWATCPISLIGIVGSLVLEANRAIGKRSDSKQHNINNNLKDFENMLVMNSENVSLTAYEYRYSRDITGSKWLTSVCLEGEAVFNGEKGDTKLIFEFVGKTYDRSFLVKANNKVPELANILNIPVPQIERIT